MEQILFSIEIDRKDNNRVKIMDRCGNGAEYIVLAKINGEYKTHTEADSLKKLIEQLQKVRNEAIKKVMKNIKQTL